ncbi:MAG: TonB-dependent receptor [bacterium]|nr:TonB-dependent receptor [bacterium]
MFQIFKKTGLRKGFFLLAFMSSWAFLGSASAQFEEEDFFKVDEWVETASKRLQRIEQSPAAVTVINADEIRESGATNLGDLLRRVPGLEVMSISPSDFEIGARGTNKPMENGVLVMVDGRSIYQDYFGIVVWSKMDIPLEQIDKIEVVRGPGSVLYGANALHAVVNIITQAPGSSPGTSLSITGGPGTIIGTIMDSGTRGKVSHLFSAGWTQRGSYEHADQISVQYPRGHAALNFDLGRNGNIELEAGMDAGKSETFHDAIGMIKAFSMTHNLTAKYSRPDFYFRTFWNALDANRYYAPKTLFDNLEVFPGFTVRPAEGWKLDTGVESNVLDFETQKIQELGKSQLITGGASYRYVTVKSSLMENYETQHLVGAYLQHEFNFRNMVTTYLGARGDYHPVTGFNLSPRGSLLLSPHAGHVFRFSAGRSFRNPTFTENYFKAEVPLEIVNTVYTMSFSGDPDLNPDELISYEAGYVADLFRGTIRGSLNLFYNQLSDVIWYSFPGGLLGGVAQMANLYDEEARGVEAELKASPYYWLSSFVNYTYTDMYFTGVKQNGRMVDPSEVADFDKSDRRTPRHKINGGVTVNLKNGFSSTLLVHHVGSTYWPPNIDRNIMGTGIGIFELGKLPAYNLVNLRLGYRFWQGRAEASVYVYNLLHDEHKEYPRYGETIGTQVSASARVTF